VKLPPDATSEAPPAPSIFTVLERQVGLKLDPIKDSQGFIVVDRITRPRAGD
jgi:uncharacterized protein (TIGR03435 family)